MFVDGGLLNNLPADLVKKAGMPFVIAVDVEREYTTREPKSMIEVMNRSLQIMRMETKKKTFPYADIILKPDVGRYAAYDLSKIQHCIIAGEAEAYKKMDLMMHLLQQRV